MATPAGNPVDTAWSVGHERAEGCEELGEWEESLNKIVQGISGSNIGTASESEGVEGESIGSAIKHAQEWVTEKATSPWKDVRRRLYPERSKPVASASKDRKTLRVREPHRGLALDLVSGAADIVRYAGERVGLFRARTPAAALIQASSRSVIRTKLSRRAREGEPERSRANERRGVDGEGGEGAGRRPPLAEGDAVAAEPQQQQMLPLVADGGGDDKAEAPEVARGMSVPVIASAKRQGPRKRPTARHGSWSCEGGDKVDDRLPPKAPDMEWLCLPYYLLHGYLHMTFITDKAQNMNNLGSEQKAAMLLLLALSVGNFLSTTTTPSSPLPFLVVRGVCDALNIAHSIALILISIWVPRMEVEHAVLFTWLADFPTLAHTAGLPTSHVAATIGPLALLLGLVRVASDLKIDTAPRVVELPVCVCGLSLIFLIPANVGYPTDSKGALAAVSSGHVLTSGLVLALLDLGAPPQRAFKAPLMSMVITSLWSLAVAAAGILLGPDALPWPGMPFFVLLPVTCLLLSKHI